jgi:hypothetical protein
MWGAKIRRPPGEITDLQQDPKFWSPTRDLWGAEIRFARNCRSHSGRNSRFCPQAETQRQIDGPTEAIGGRSGGRGRSQAPFLFYMGLDAERRLGPSSRSQDNGGGDFKANRVYGPHRIACGVQKLGAHSEKSAICRQDADFGTPQGNWSAYAGGFYLRTSGACVPLVFNNGRQTTTVRFGIGAHCP